MIRAIAFFVLFMLAFAALYAVNIYVYQNEPATLWALGIVFTVAVGVFTYKFYVAVKEKP